MRERKINTIAINNNKKKYIKTSRLIKLIEFVQNNNLHNSN